MKKRGLHIGVVVYSHSSPPRQAEIWSKLLLNTIVGALVCKANEVFAVGARVVILKESWFCKHLVYVKSTPIH